METNDILLKLTQSLDTLLSMQNQTQVRKFDWVKIVAGLSPFIIASAVSITVAFTRLSSKLDLYDTKIENVQKEIKQAKTDENNRAVKVDYNFSIIQLKYPEMLFIDTKNTSVN